ncbi:MAG: hypothetical protein A2Y12_16375 [Planctomycetes bacterium GWF2_42_9]|nr:MAG: hypothetical protein A2Y12_16375 [Planctomycetes bacterium GWF2_42_9]
MVDQAIFFGHFNLGEIIREETIATIREGSSEQGIFCILVGDVAFREKVHRFIRNGKNGVIDIYKRRWDCSKGRLCTRLQAYNPECAENIIDWEQLNIAKKIIINRSISLYLNLKTSQSLDAKDTDYILFSEIIKNEIAPAIFKIILCQMGLNQAFIEYGKQHRLEVHAINLFSELNLINIAKRRIRKRYAKLSQSWRNIGKNFEVDTENTSLCYLNKQSLTSINGAPLCISIILALYQELTRQNIIKVTEIYPIDSCLPLLQCQQLISEIASSGVNILEYWNLQLVTHVTYKTDNGSILQKMVSPCETDYFWIISNSDLKRNLN